MTSSAIPTSASNSHDAGNNRGAGASHGAGKAAGKAKRIALIHALAHSPGPIREEFQRQWPECFLMNLLDDSLSADLAAAPGGLDEAMIRRFQSLGDYAVATGADAILFTCSAFGPCIEAVATRHPQIPVRKPNEAMIAQAVALRTRVGLIASGCHGCPRHREIGRARPAGGRSGAAAPCARLRRHRAHSVQHGPSRRSGVESRSAAGADYSRHGSLGTAGATPG
jgi:hypothetical protein